MSTTTTTTDELGYVSGADQEAGVLAVSAALLVPIGPADRIAERRTCDLLDAVNIPTYRAYTRGVHANALTDKQRTALAGLLAHDFCDNVCQQIVSIAADRVELERFDVAAPVETDADDKPVANPLEMYLDELRIKNQIDAMQAEISYSTFRDGNHYIGIAWKDDSKRSIWIHEPTWDGSEGMHLFYDKRRVPEFAVKEYVEDASDDPAKPDYVRRRVLYYPDHIEYWELKGERTEWRKEKPDDPWTTNEQFGGDPLGIPIFHFANASRTGLPHGDSDLSGGVIGVQDQINDAQWDLSASGRYTGYQRTWSAGVDMNDADGNAIPFDASPGAHQSFLAPDAKMGVIPAGDSSNLIAIIREKRDTACRMTATPSHLVTVGSNTTGEAILRAEAPLENKAKKVANRLAPSYASAAHFSVVLSNAKGATNLDTDVMIQAVMAPASRRDPLSVATQVQTIAPFIDAQTRLELLGFTAARAKEILANMKAEQEQAMALVPASANPVPPTD